MYAIETEGLSKSFNAIKAVDGLCLRVPEGSIYGFLGPNGAGKTTTIKMLTGLSKPSSGRIRICGNEAKFGKSGYRRIFGFLPDVPQFYDWMTAREYLAFCGEIFGIDKKTIKSRTDELIELVGLKGVNKKLHGYSRGMKQRLGIAQALINNPKVVFMDEPTSALDPIGRKEVMDIMQKLAGRATVFFSTHILADVERVCDRVAILDKGRLMLEDGIEALRRKYTLKSFIIETEPGAGIKLCENLKGQPWVRAAELVDKSSDELTVQVSDINKAEHAISGILSATGIGLRKFLIKEPSLEDIFMKVVNSK